MTESKENNAAICGLMPGSFRPAACLTDHHQTSESGGRIAAIACRVDSIASDSGYNAVQSYEEASAPSSPSSISKYNLSDNELFL
ncbi:hypothetical protein AB6A40_009634 [Gnathostoma spinigerum]|uniref:Uncharacterized protein n=1 Tax=Gnathostoma spinigerum TaxID=75299 RepID=A0ABD6ESI1_9BILA